MKFKYLSKAGDYAGREKIPTQKDQLVMLLNRACEHIERIESLLPDIKKQQREIEELKKMLVLIYKRNKELYEGKK